MLCRCVGSGILNGKDGWSVRCHGSGIRYVRVARKRSDGPRTTGVATAGEATVRVTVRSAL
jgi:hypothetical protein